MFFRLLRDEYHILSQEDITYYEKNKQNNNLKAHVPVISIENIQNKREEIKLREDLQLIKLKQDIKLDKSLKIKLKEFPSIHNSFKYVPN